MSLLVGKIAAHTAHLKRNGLFTRFKQLLYKSCGGKKKMRYRDRKREIHREKRYREKDKKRYREQNLISNIGNFTCSRLVKNNVVFRSDPSFSLKVGFGFTALP